jgi:ankyrin repeat protein
VRHHLQSPAASTEKSVALPVSQSEASLPSYDAVIHDKEVKKNLENCIKSAERVWSTTSNAIATVKGSIDELSVIGEPLSPISLHDINEWVGRLSTDERDTLPADDSAGSVLTSNISHEHETATESLSSVADDMLFKEDSLFNSDEEMFHIEACEEEAAKSLESGDFSAAEDAQKDAIRYLERRHARMGTPFEKKNEMREVLTKIYYKQEKLEKAAETLKLLSLTEESPPDRPWKWQHRLAEVYIELDRLNDALRWCGVAKRGREKEHGTQHPLFLESIVLSARIYELRGDTRIVGTWRKMYPAAFASTRNEEKRQESVMLLQQNGFDCSSENFDSARGVEWAASQGQLEAVRYLLTEEQAEPIASQRLETKGLVSAASSGQLAVVQMLLEKNINVDVTNAEGSTALLLAVQNGHKEVVRILLDKGANVEARDRQRRRTALHLAQFRHENEEISRMLINKGADVNAREWKKQRPLHIASEHGERTAAEILLRCGADIHARDDTSRTALHLAICEKHLDLVKLLLAYGAQGDLGLVGIAKTRSIPAIAKLVEEKVKQQEEEKSRLEKEKKKRAKELKEQEKESKKKSKDRKPSSGGLDFLSRRKSTQV